ncbi:MAG: hypothetical protein ACTSRA_00635 [Promethearchaeota archaeon]|nr:MAG: hypothetical protein [Helarchaeota virus Nidhogg Meg22_1012]URC17464.1 MAG: hypothetical protein [Helarchaeota virus Nidhogg Meg22_1214]
MTKTLEKILDLAQKNMLCVVTINGDATLCKFSIHGMLSPIAKILQDEIYGIKITYENGHFIILNMPDFVHYIINYGETRMRGMIDRWKRRLTM